MGVVSWTAAMEGARGSLVLLLAVGTAAVEATQKVNSTGLKLESGSGLKNYEEEEEGTVLPYRTFLTTVEVIVICVFTVIIFVLSVLLVIYLCVYGCVIPDCCKSENGRRQKYGNRTTQGLQAGSRSWNPEIT